MNYGDALSVVSSDIRNFDRYDLGWKVYGLNKSKTKLYKEGGVDFDWIRRENEAGKYILDYDKNERIISRMTESYGALGFTFKMDGDDLTIYFQDETGGKVNLGTFTTDRTFGSRKDDENKVINAMKTAWDNSDARIQHFSKQRIEKDGNKYSILAN